MSFHYRLGGHFERGQVFELVRRSGTSPRTWISNPFASTGPRPASTDDRSMMEQPKQRTSRGAGKARTGIQRDNYSG